MNRDIRLSTGFWQHPKTKKTIKKLGLEGIQALQVLWLWAAINRPDGRLVGMDWEDIELTVDWQGEEKAFFDVCVGDGNACMWIDTQDGTFVLHDWVEHNPWQAEAESRSNAARFSNLAKMNKPLYETLKSQGIKGLSKEEFERCKTDDVPIPRSYETNTVSANKGNSDKLLHTHHNLTMLSEGDTCVTDTTPLRHGSVAKAKRPSPSPSPSPQPKRNKNTQYTSNAIPSHSHEKAKSNVCVHTAVSGSVSHEQMPSQLIGVSGSVSHEQMPSQLIGVSGIQMGSQTINIPESDVSNEQTEQERTLQKETLPQGTSFQRGSFQKTTPIKTDSPSKGTPEWSNFLHCYEAYPVQKNREGAWRAWIELSQRGILDPSAYILDKIIELKTNDSQWLAGYAPNMERWLRNKGWNDKPYVKPKPAKEQHSFFPATPKTPEQKAQEKQKAEAFLSRKREEARRETAKILEQRQKIQAKQQQKITTTTLSLVEETEQEKKQREQRQEFLKQQFDAVINQQITT